MLKGNDFSVLFVLRVSDSYSCMLLTLDTFLIFCVVYVCVRCKEKGGVTTFRVFGEEAEKWIGGVSGCHGEGVRDAESLLACLVFVSCFIRFIMNALLLKTLGRFTSASSFFLLIGCLSVAFF